MPLSQSTSAVVNSTTTGTQNTSSVLTLSDGRTVVAWIDANSGSIRGAFVGLDGARIGTDFEWSPAASATMATTIALNATPDGGFSITWRNSIDDLVTLSVDSAGVEGSATAVPSSNTGEESMPSAVTLADGSMLTAWFQGQDGRNGICGCSWRWCWHR
jgi:hypothetical protein